MDRSTRPVPAKTRRLAFDGYVLDLDRGCLLSDGSEIELRPKTFAVLCHLVENAGRLVSKEELFSAVWSDVTVTDDTIVQSVGELRRALGAKGTRLITTVPKRGYRFEGIVSSARIVDSSDTAQRYESRDVPQLRAAAIAGEPGGHLPGRRLGLLADRRAWAGIAIVVALAAAWMWMHTGMSQHTGRGVGPSVKSTVEGARPAIAVMPFVDRASDSARDYFADGVTQDIIAGLGRSSGLTVMSWNAVLPFKGKAASPEAISLGLGVRYQVEGSVTQAGDRVRIAAQLVASDGRVLWSAQFDEALADVFTLQDRITTEIAGALSIRITEAEQRRAFAKPTGSLEAYDHVLRARPALQRPSRAGIADARALLRRAIELDPDYASAHAALAETFYIAVSWGWAETPQSFLDSAEGAATTALRLDDSEVRARVILGRVHLAYNRFEQAQAEMERAIALNPSDAHGLAGRGNVLMWLGQTDAAVESLERALRIDPELNAIDRFALSLAYYLKRRYDAAIEQAQLNLRNSESAFFNSMILAASAGQLGRSEDAARAVREMRTRDPTFDVDVIGSKLRNPEHLKHLREGLTKAGA